LLDAGVPVHVVAARCGDDKPTPSAAAAITGAISKGALR